jgi:predicted transposase YbfD/YdcC
MVAAATISGARSFRSVADYVADLPPDALARLGARRHPVTGRLVAPSEATIRRTVKDINADEADTIVGTWLHAKLQAGLVSPKAWRGLAVDGKTLKGSWEHIDTGAGKVRLFSALTHADGVVLGQRKIPENTGEQAQMIPLLDQVAGAPPDGQTLGDLSGVVVTADALHVHRRNVEQILARNGEYVLTVKRNHPILHNSIKALFADADGAFPPHHVTFDRGHGRDETRSIICTPHVADLNFPGVYQAWAITREVSNLHGNPPRTRNETVYGITSLTTYQANPTDVLAFNRGHWEIENRKHHIRNTTFNEDRSQVRTGSSPHIMTTMRNIAISLLRLAGWTNTKQATEKMSRPLDQVLNLLSV